ncbi:hypothetical protein HYPSUDRAFT_41120 [Hypholoma sublateritium FD-334 SS-4]|uniref:Apple domain-containing protein n=1 Tax=Hypholoma sublateritium (strain FD-334 SS-4) TaxID=945553 RepID=A0A0D2L5V1_HYPSF|nr:hypothetical protein HYPSUDRAFT_41120 [Hypholoma sublateritium FD-334 SS-4]
MYTFTKFLSAVSLAVAASALVTNIVPPASQGAWNDPSDALIPDNTATTDTDSIVSTASIVDQKSGAAGDTDPNQPVPPVTVTAVDGDLTNTTIANLTSTRRRSARSLSRRDPSDYELVFSGSGTGPTDRDASIEGTAYLTFTLVPNSTYNVDACLAFCDSVTDCVFANIFYELNNPGLEVLSSNLKCAVYSDVHTAAEKINFGGQQLAPPPAGLTFIQDSSGYSSKTLVDPADPEGYELVFGPLDGANNAPGYMGFAFLDRYDVNACAALCNTRGADSQGGACQFFNIWRAVVNGVPTTYTCSMYFIVADATTAVNTGQGDLQVTFSRGYKRTNLVIDGGFEGFNECDDFCFDTQDANWIGTSAPGGTLDATIFFFQPYAHSGNAVALLGSATAEDSLPGTLTIAKPLTTIAGNTYSINFFQASAFSGPTLEANAFVDILWNNKIVATITPGFENYVFYQFTVTAVGNDVLAFHGGAAPAWSFIDDISVFQQ